MIFPLKIKLKIRKIEFFECFPMSFALDFLTHLNLMRFLSVAEDSRFWENQNFQFFERFSSRTIDLNWSRKFGILRLTSIEKSMNFPANRKTTKKVDETLTTFQIFWQNQSENFRRYQQVSLIFTLFWQVSFFWLNFWYNFHQPSQVLI